MEAKAKWPATWLQTEGRTIYALEHHGWDDGKETFRNRFSANVQAGGGSDIADEELAAIAGLMTAAPDLYEALKAMYDTRECFPPTPELFAQVVAALRKADANG